MKSRHQILNASARGYVTVNAHFLHDDKMWSVLAINEMFGSHTGENVKNVLTNILTEWHILEQIITIASDNAANMKTSY